MSTLCAGHLAKRFACIVLFNLFITLRYRLLNSLFSKTTKERMACRDFKKLIQGQQLVSEQTPDSEALSPYCSPLLYAHQLHFQGACVCDHFLSKYLSSLLITVC